jgi:hypothetical protein
VFAVACAAAWIANPLQGPRWELVLAASRYDALLVKPPAGAPPEVRHRAAYLAGLVWHLQRDAVDLWRSGLKGGYAESDAPATHNMLLTSKEIVLAVKALDHPAGMLESYWIQASVVDKLALVCTDLRINPKSPWVRHLPAHLHGARHTLRTTFIPILRLTN